MKDLPVVSDKVNQHLQEHWEKMSPSFEKWANEMADFPFELELDLTTHNKRF